MMVTILNSADCKNLSECQVTSKEKGLILILEVKTLFLFACVCVCMTQ